MPEQYSSQENRVKVDRRFLLFQLDLSDSVRSVTPFAEDVQSNVEGGEKDFRFIDPMEYELPSNENRLYWRNVLNEGYDDEFKSAMKQFQAQLYKDIKRGVSVTQAEQAPDYITSNPGLSQENPELAEYISSNARPGVILRREDGKTPYVDISEYVKTVSNYTNTVSGFANELSLTLGLPESDDPNDPTLTKLAIGENDIIMVRTAYNDSPVYELEFLGFVTDADVMNRYGSVSGYNVKVDGISKFFETTHILKQKSVDQRQFLPGIEVSSTRKGVSLYSDEFNAFDLRNILTAVLRDALNVVPTNAETDYTVDFSLDGQAFAPDADDTSQLPFQHALLVLVTLYLMSITPAPKAQANRLDLYNPGDGLTRPNVLDRPVRAVLENGKHKVYNKMVTTGLATFFAQLSTPRALFDDMRNFTFYDIFERRDGTLITRPPHFNRIEIGDGGATEPPKWEDIFTMGLDASGVFSGRAVFNPAADFFVDSYHYLGEVNELNSDAEMETHTDTQSTWELVGVSGNTGFPGGKYTDPNLLVKYGLRGNGPLNNPNVTNNQLAKLLAPIAQGVLNARTRQLTARVADTKKYLGGKLYYFSPFSPRGAKDSTQNPGFVAFLDTATLSHAYGQVSAVDMNLVMARQVVYRKISDILAADNEVLNFAMMYLPALPLYTGEKNPRTAMIAYGRKELEYLRGDVDQGYTEIPMFKYVPSILDLILELEQDPGKAEPAKNYAGGTTAEDVSNEKAGSVNIDGYLYALGLSGAIPSFKNYAEDVAIIETEVIKVNGDLSQALRSTEVSAVQANPTGIIQYNALTEDTKYLNQSIYVPAIKTPFRVAQISSDTSSWRFSQLLTDRLAALDLRGKYEDSDSALIQRYLPTPEGGYLLFGQEDPKTWLTQENFFKSKRRLSGLRKNGEAQYPILALTEDNNKNPLKFSSEWFSVPLDDDFPNEFLFNLPPGDLMYVNESTERAWTAGEIAKFRRDFSISPESYNFFRLSGGRYRIKRNTPTDVKSYRIQPLGGATILDTNTSRATPVGAGSALVLPASGPLLLLTPYTEMSIERLVELNLPPEISAYRGQTENATIRKALGAEGTRYKEDNDYHANGRAIKLCPDMVVASSGSDLQFATRSTPRAILNHIRTMAKKASVGFKDPEAFIYPIVIPADPLKDGVLIIDSTYTDGTPAASVKAPVLTLAVSRYEENAYAKTLVETAEKVRKKQARRQKNAEFQERYGNAGGIGR